MVMAQYQPTPPFGGLHLYDAQYPSNPDHMRFENISAQHQSPPGSTHYGIYPYPLSSSNQSTNAYAFKGNSEARNANITSNPERRFPNFESGQIQQESVFYSDYKQPSTTTHKPLAFDPQTLQDFPPANHSQSGKVLSQPLTQAPAAKNTNGEEGRIIEASKSDLEDGEVSDEGAKISNPIQSSSPQEPTQGLGSNYLAHSASENKYPNSLGEVRQDVSSGRQFSIQNASQMELNQTNANKPSTIKVVKSRLRARKRLSRQETYRRAEQAISQLQNCKVGYLKLMMEGLDPESLKHLFSEINPRVTYINLNPLVTLNETSQAAPSASRPVRDTYSVASAIDTIAVSSLKNNPDPEDTVPLKPERNGRTDDFRTSGTLEAEPLDQIDYLETQGKLHQSMSSRQKVSTTFQEASPRADDVESAKAMDSESREKTSDMRAIVNGHKPEVSQMAALRPLQSQSNKMPVKVDIQAPTDKIMERKDYIARMLAAKAKKPLTSGLHLSNKTLSKPTLSTKGLSSSTTIFTNSKSSRPEKDVKRNDPPQPAEQPLRQSSLPPPTLSGMHLEAKKREQTELARKRIEELKNRNKSSQQVPPATNVETPEADEPSLFSEKSVAIPPESSTVEGMLPKSSQLIAQRPYFPPHDPQTTFTIPGLFMASKPALQIPPNEPPPSLMARKPLPDSDDPLVKGIHNGVVAHLATQLQATSATLEKIDVSEQALQPTDKLSTNQKSVSPTAKGLRKRSTAADFIEPEPTRIKISESYKQENPVIIGSSDEENDESDEGDLDMDIDSDQEIPSTQADIAHQHTSKIYQLTSTQNVAPLSVSQASSKQKRNGPISSLPGSQTLGKSNDQGGLRSKEEEIERMNRKIAEMEQRIKIKQAASRVHSPGVLEQQSTSVEFNGIEPDPQHSFTVEKKTTESETQIEEEKAELEDVRKAEAALQEQLNNEYCSLHAQTNDALVNADGNVAIDLDQEQRQRRKAELESSIPSLNAIIEDCTSKLQALKDEEAIVEAQISKQVAGRRILQEELERLSRMASISSAIDSIEQANGDTSTVPDARKDEAIDHAMQHQTREKNWYLQADPTRAKQYAASPDGSNSIAASSFGPSPPIELAPPSNAPSEHSVAMAEQAEDIVGNIKEGGKEATENLPSSSSMSPVIPAESESEEPYEPPPSFDQISDRPKVQPASQTVLPQVDQNTRQPSSDNRHSEQETDASPLVRALALNEADSGDGMITSRGHSLADNSDSDDYEPPEPISPMEAAPLALELTSADLNNPQSILETDLTTRVELEAPTSNFDDQGHIDADSTLLSLPEQDKTSTPQQQFGHFSSYESPLKQFHAYRYHPDFASEVGNGYRSLTYSHNIDATKPVCRFEIGGRCNDASCSDQHFRSMSLSDDMILVQMGAVPEGLTGEQRDEFVVGLRHIIKEIRSKKVRDFKTVAQEISAYRMRFLGDSSKILSL